MTGDWWLVTSENKIKKLSDLNVYVSAANIAIMTLKMLNDTKINWALRDQLFRAVCSIGANIAEGFGRNSTKEFVQFLYIARGSLYETKHFLYLTQKTNTDLTLKVTHVLNELELLGKMLNSLIRALKSSHQPLVTSH